MALIEMQNIKKDYFLGETVVHALRGSTSASKRVSSSRSGGLPAPARRPFLISSALLTNQPEAL